MNLFVISVDDQPGAFGRLLDATARRGVNVAPAYGLADAGRGLVAVGSDDEDGLRAAIAEVGYTATAYDLVVVEVENRPGTGAELTRALAGAGVNLRAVVPVGMNGDRLLLGFGADDPAAVRRALGR